MTQEIANAMDRRKRAAELFIAFDKARIACLFHGAPEPCEVSFGYRHGWIQVDGENFNREMLMDAGLLPRTVTYNFD